MFSDIHYLLYADDALLHFSEAKTLIEVWLFNLVRDLFGHLFPLHASYLLTHTHRNRVLLIGSCIGNVLCHLGPLQTPDVNNYCSYIIYTFANQCFATVLSSSGAAARVC